MLQRVLGEAVRKKDHSSDGVRLGKSCNRGTLRGSSKTATLLAALGLVSGGTATTFSSWPVWRLQYIILLGAGLEGYSTAELEK